MPIYQLEFDWFEKSVWFGGEIEYCAICPYMARVSGSVPDLPKIKVPQIKLDRKAKLLLFLFFKYTFFYFGQKIKNNQDMAMAKMPLYGQGERFESRPPQNQSASNQVGQKSKVVRYIRFI